MPPKSPDGPRPHPFQPPQGALALIAGSASPILAGKVAAALGVRLTPSEAHAASWLNVDDAINRDALFG